MNETSQRGGGIDPHLVGGADGLGLAELRMKSG